MRNYFSVLRLDRIAPSAHLKNALQELTEEQLAEEDDIADVLAKEQRRTHYRRVHLQYDAISAVVNGINYQSATDTHSWKKRTVEFDPVQDTIELSQR